jgi:cell division protein FtsW
VNGARRWVGAGPLTVQPSELMKLSLVLYGAQLLAADPGRVKTLKGIVSPLLVIAGAACALVAVQPDLGTALVIAFTLCALLVAAGMPLRHLAVLGGLAAAAVILFAIAEPYRRARLTAFLNPWADAGGAGFQAVQGQIAVGSGGLFGVGLGESVQKVFYLPEAHTDFILAVIGEELGLAGVLGVLFLYGMIAYAGLRVAKAASTRYAKLLAAGITSLILSQATLNVFAVLGLAPLTGVPLPFISYGSSNLMVLLAAMGLLLNVAAGGKAQLRVVRPSRSSNADSRDRRRRDSRARRARAGGRRRATG